MSVYGILTLLLSSSILATPTLFQDDSRNSTNSSVSIMADRPHGFQRSGRQPGDTLNVTRCYCASTTWDEDGYFGYYYRWDYYNIHANLQFQMERRCKGNSWTRGGILGSVAYQLICLRPRRDEKDCMKDSHHNKFCYHYSGRERFDQFSFNGQYRGLPLDSPVAIREPVENVKRKCQSLCREQLGSNPAMDLLNGRSMYAAEKATPPENRFHSGDNEWSHIAYYPEVDDMCHGCR